MVLYGCPLLKEEEKFIRSSGMGYEIIKYATPANMDAFDRLHPEVTQSISGMRGLSMHGSFHDLSCISADPLILEVTKKRYTQSIKAAAFHGVNRLVFHSPYAFFFGTNTTRKEQFIKVTSGFWKSFEENIPEGMTVFIENLADDDPEWFGRLISGIASPKIKACLDIGHANCNSPVPLDEWVRTLGDKIGHVHLHDNDGKHDRHWALGKGTIPLKETITLIMARAGEDVPFVLECDPVKSAVWLKENHLWEARQ